jgi:hypothetical protein
MRHCVAERTRIGGGKFTGLLDLVEVAASGLVRKSQYQMYLAEFDHAPFGKLEPLARLKTNPGGAGIVQAIGPLKNSG